jgi:ankyrin repeat protein
VSIIASTPPATIERRGSEYSAFLCAALTLGLLFSVIMILLSGLRDARYRPSVRRIRIKHGDITYTFTGPHMAEEALLCIRIAADLAPSTNTLWHEVVETGNPKLIQLLLRKGYNINARDGDGRTPISYAAEKGCEAIVTLLAENEADVNLKDNEGIRPLDWAVDESHNIIVLVLLRCGADVNRRRSDGATQLMVAASRGDTALVRLMLKNGADVEGTGFGGDTALHEAAEFGRGEVVQLLLENGADPSAKNAEKKTPSSKAKASALKFYGLQSNQFQIVRKLLRQARAKKRRRHQ